ncbi:50S ribosomal protein L5 [Candidatus Dependentiae bacterium]|nr:50S ribosomal protein L5 [Candidatus Dependentiae bacterium]MBU4387591.1 50S ribosomal protein L5 [Candidatus Dependentiae bacterium]MCG2756287.1 50S ribosomal protein L5 [Candidatus Dependentiae bacterium]
MESRLEVLYKKEIRKKLKKDLDLGNIMQVPKVTKIVLNMGVKDAIADSKVLNLVKEVVTRISGQAAVKTYAKKSIAGFKLREGMAIGVMVTLRGHKMYDFLDRLVNIAVPRIKDFHGLKPKLDGDGNYNLGIKDWMVFPEVDYDSVDKSRGLNVTIHTSARKDDHAIALLKSFNMPFKQN